MTEPLEGLEELLWTLQQRIGRDGTLSGNVEDAYCRCVRAVGLQYAHHYGLAGEEGEDCAQGLVARLLPELHQQGPELLLKPSFIPWLKACARHHVQNDLRTQGRHRRRCLPLEAVVLVPLPKERDGIRLLEAAWGQEAFWGCIGEATAQVEEAPAAMLVAHYGEEVEIAEIAAVHRCTPQAVRQSLYRSRGRLKELLEAKGSTEAELRSLLDN